MSNRIEAYLRNVGYAARGLARSPVFTLTVVLTLSIGIGANSAVFSAIDAVLLQPLPLPDGDRLVSLSQTEQEGGPPTNVAPVRLEDWRVLSSAFAGITGHYIGSVSDTTHELPERVRQATVAPGFVEAWGVRPALGRGFTPAEHRLGGPGAILISERYWRTRLGADPDVLTRTVRSNGQSYAIVGVMPASFAFPDRTVDFWEPHPVDAPFAQSREAGWYTAVGRLRPGVTIEQARANLRSVQMQLAEQHGGVDAEIGIRIEPLKRRAVAGVSGSLWLLFGAVTLLLLIACTNIAALLLSRAAERREEIALRYSLGASRAAVAGQMLAEAAVLALAGAAAGLLVAAGTLRMLRVLAPELPRLDEVAIDLRVLAYTMVSAVVVALACGVFPAIQNARQGAAPAGGSRTQVSPRHSLQWGLVGVQVALSVTLLAGAGLLVRSFEALSRVDAGFDATNVLTFQLSTDFAESSNFDRVVERHNGTLDELGTLPGVEVAALSYYMPGVPSPAQLPFELVEGAGDVEPALGGDVAEHRTVSPGYFETMRIPLLAGELCRRPTSSEAMEAMVNAEFTRRYVPGRSAVGLSLAYEDDNFFGVALLRIAGVVGDAREAGIDRPPVPVVYVCTTATIPPRFLLRTSVDPMALAGDVRRRLARLEPLRSVYDIATVELRIGAGFAQQRLVTVLLAAFAVTALALACLGVYGTLSYAVSLRRREVGLRMALGAVSGNIVLQLVANAFRVVAVASVAGLALSLLFARGLSGMLYGVSPSDPVTLASVAAIVMGVAVLAAWIPAVRAAHIDPMRALRDE